MIRRTVRVRLTAVYTSLSLINSVVLLVAMNLLLEHNLRPSAHRLPGWKGPRQPSDMATAMHTMFVDVRTQVLRDQWMVSGLTIGALTVTWIAVGWIVAGRALRPLHRITATARRLSLSNLHERIALTGPRDELTELADTFDAMLDRLQEAAEAQARFVANASHELRTPLAIQRTALQVGLDRASPEKLSEVRRELLKLNQRSERLIDGLFLLAQSEHGLESTGPVALDHLVRQVIGETQAPGVTIRHDLGPALITGDLTLLNRLVANLVGNAVKYNHPGGEVGLRTTPDGTLTVSNTGPCIPEDRLGELFEPFRRLHPRTRATDGADLGLSIAAAIARAHGARITAIPNPRGGLSVTVAFPPVMLDPRPSGTGQAAPEPRRPARTACAPAASSRSTAIGHDPGD